MKIFTAAQIHELDKYTIEHEPVKGIDLMERAAKALAAAIMEEWADSTPMVVFAGPGNNGGDALAVARLLADAGYKVSVYLFNIHDKLSDDCAANRDRLVEQRKVQFTEISVNFDPPKLNADTVVVDGLFGSGLNKTLMGGFASLVKYVNQSPCQVVSIDLPSGLMCEDNTYNVNANIIRANLTLTIQQKKLSMLFADCQQFIGRLKVIDIRLSPEYIMQTEAKCRILEENDVAPLLRHRSDFANKGTMGHSLIVAGSFGMSGAAVLATKACLRSGVGKVTVHTPARNYDIMQISVPEAVLQLERVVTVSGLAMKQSGNFLVRMGTSAASLIDLCGGLPEGSNKVLSGGPMMGRALTSLEAPIVKGSNAITVLTGDDNTLRMQPRPCVRCAKCVGVCPMGLEPYLLATASALGDWERAEREYITSCIECGSCQYTCPSARPLLDNIRKGKATVMGIIKARRQQPKP